jgi:hypothetical protein
MAGRSPESIYAPLALAEAGYRPNAMGAGVALRCVECGAEADGLATGGPIALATSMRTRWSRS